jgi:hypothetical protein
MSIAIIDWKYNALTNYLHLESSIMSLISDLREKHMSEERLLQRLETMQKDVQGVGHYFQSYKALIHHRHLTLDLTSHVDGVRMRTINTDELVRCLELCDRDVDGLDEYFKDELSPIYWNVRRADDSTMAQAVFGIPEMLENILSNCGVLDVLKFYQTCKGVRDIIDGSSKLQIQMCLKPAAEGTPRRQPFGTYHLSSFNCTLATAATWPPGNTIESFVGCIAIEMDPDGVYLPRIGQRVQDMLICQPPIYKVLLTESCPLDDNEFLGDIEYTQLESKTGVTIRDLYAMAERLMDLHSGCRDPRGYAFYGMEPHRVTVRIRFKECLSANEWADAVRNTITSWEFIEKEEKKGVERRFVSAACQGSAAKTSGRREFEGDTDDCDRYDLYDSLGEKTPERERSASVSDDYDCYDEEAGERVLRSDSLVQIIFT